MNLKKRKQNSHKGQNGIILIIAGSKDFPGAAFLATQALASLRAGNDLTILACPEKVAWAINSLNPDIITVKLKGDYLNLKHYKTIKRYIDKSDIILIGNGISQNKQTQKLVKKIIKTTKPKVIDADAIKAISLKEVDNSIITPHKKEFEILLKNSGLTKKNYRKHLKNNIILLKGPIDYIISKNKIKTNKTGNAGMTIGGTGDILAGLAAGLATKTTLFNAAYLAAKLNGKIGDKLKNSNFIASDFLALIGKEAKISIFHHSANGG